MLPAELRKQLLANGYTPLANKGKMTLLKGWPKLEVTEALIDSWERKYRRFPDTGLRIEGGLCAIDFDIDDEKIMEKVAARVKARFPKARGALVRYGKGYKEAWFCRTAEPFGRIASFRYIAPGRTLDDGEPLFVEIFGGGSPRQFGAFGAHTRSDSGEVIVEYEWADISPLDMPRGELPLFTKEELREITAITGATLREAGCEQVLHSAHGENKATRVYDLTDEMLFECNDWVTRTLEQLAQIAGEKGLRCSASWLEPGSQNRERCIVGWSHKHGCVFVWESASSVTHMPAANRPVSERELSQRLASLDLGRMRPECSHD